MTNENIVVTLRGTLDQEQLEMQLGLLDTVIDRLTGNDQVALSNIRNLLESVTVALDTDEERVFLDEPVHLIDVGATQPPMTEMIESVIKRAQALVCSPDVGPEVGIVLLHGDPNDHNRLAWTGPFKVDEVNRHVDEEMLAGAAIVFPGEGEVEFSDSSCYCNDCLEG